MTCVGITGGIGSGKTLISDILRALGFPVFDCDKEAKRLYDEDEELKGEVIRYFGAEVYETPTGKLDRKLLAERIFSSDEARGQINALVHPAVRRAFKLWVEQQKIKGHQLCFLESAILFQSGLAEMLDKTLLVEADDALRLKRASQRDGVDEALIRERMACQMPQAEQKKRADYIINNNLGQAVLPQINEFLKQIL